MRAIFVLAALGGMAAPAAAEDWRLAAVNQTVAVFVDLSTIRRSGDMATFATWTIPRRRGQSGADNVKGVRRANCSNDEFTEIERTYMYGDEVIAKMGEAALSKAPPNSIAEGTNQYVCFGNEEGPDPNFPDPYKETREGFWVN